MIFILTSEMSLVNEKGLTSPNLSGTNCQKNDTRPPSCIKPKQPTMYELGRMEKKESYSHV